METKTLLNNPSSLPNRSPILVDMLRLLANQIANPIISASPAVREMQNKEKDKL